MPVWVFVMLSKGGGAAVAMVMCPRFEPVSMKMAKGQNLTLNPTKFSGLCGKLMCCLRYEYGEPEQGPPNMPAIGMVVMTPLGRAKVEEVS